jgi:hypothetical protein
VKFPKYELGGYFRESFFMWLLIKKHLGAGNRRFATTAEEQGEVTESLCSKKLRMDAPHFMSCACQS